jgi:predicted porin
MKMNIFTKKKSVHKTIKLNKVSQYLGLALVTFTISTSVSAEVELVTINDWKTSISGSIPVFLVSSDHEGGEKAFRVQSGFNPANLNFHVMAPNFSSGLKISGHFQIDTHLQGSQGQQNGGLFESRVARIQVDGDFGSITAGKDFGVFNSSAIGDIASQGGVGWLGGGADTGNATGGRIGTGYVYANFNPQVKFTSNDINGFIFKVAAINPEEPTGEDIETDTPRFEGQVNYQTNFDSGAFKLWGGFMQQSVAVKNNNPFDYDMTGFDVGGHVDLGDFGLTLSYTDTTGIGADGLYGGTINDADVDATQWYVEANYKINKTTIGVSYGEGQQDSRAADASKGLVKVDDVVNELAMLFVHYQMTPEFRLVGELQDYKSDAQADYNAIAFGFQFDF